MLPNYAMNSDGRGSEGRSEQAPQSNQSQLQSTDMNFASMPPNFSFGESKQPPTGAPPSTAGSSYEPQGMSAAALKGMVDPSSTAVLDACMRDLTRRRIAMAEAARYATGNAGRGNLLSSLASPGFDLNMALFNMQKFGAPHDPQEASVAASQQQRRISLLDPSGQLQMGQQPQQSVPVAKKPPPPPAGPPPQPRQWWVCRVCQSKAFASAEEAQEHESMCGTAQTRPASFMTEAAPPPQPAMQQRNQHQPTFLQEAQSNMNNTQPLDPSSFSHLYPFLPNPAAAAAAAATAAQPQPSQQSFNINISQDDVKTEMERFFQKQQEKLRQMQTLAQSHSKPEAPPTRPAQDHMPFKHDTFKHDAKPQHVQQSQSQPQRPAESSSDDDLPHPKTKPLEGPGNYATLQEALPLAMPNDKDWLTPLHCFVRRHCVEVFTATPTDVATPSKGKRKPIQVGQVGIRCPHCHPHKYPYMNRNGQVHHPRERGSVYYPTTIASIYNATMNLLQRHLHSCSSVPHDIMARYAELKADDARSGTSKKYWVDSAKSLGLIDTPKGIHFSSLRPPPLPSLSQQQFRTVVSSAGRRNSLDFFSNKSNAEPRDGHYDGESNNDSPSQQRSSVMDNSEPLVLAEDKSTATGFSYELLRQMQPCVFTEADRLGKRKGLPPGFAGLACRHCFGGYGSGRFFPSSIKTLSDTSKTLNVLHNHMMRCRKCPRDVRDRLEKLRLSHDDERAKMKFGSQKAFFAQIWSRLHDGKDNADGSTAISPTPGKMKKSGPTPKRPSVGGGGVQKQQQAPLQPKPDSPLDHPHHDDSVHQQQHQHQVSVHQQHQVSPPPLHLFTQQSQQQLPFHQSMGQSPSSQSSNSPVNHMLSAGVKRDAATMSAHLPESTDLKRMRASGA